MSNDPLYPPEAAVEYLGHIVKLSTLTWWRHVGRGPAYVKIGGRVAYRQSALEAFVETGVVKPETGTA